jgi:uncharacterized protein GlcG (DUF336 family)
VKLRDIKTLTLEEALVGLNAMLAEVKKDPSRPMALAVSNAVGHTICLYVMDGASDFVREMVQRKSFTAAQLGDTTRASRDAMRSEGMTIGGDFQHPDATTVPGGVPIVPPGTEREQIGGLGEQGVRHSRGQVGACAAGGRWADEDEEIAKVGVRAIQKYIWPQAFK